MEHTRVGQRLPAGAAFIEYSPLFLAFATVTGYNKFTLGKSTQERELSEKGRACFMASGKILIVDDDTNICELLRLYIEKEGFEASIANDGKLL